MTKSLTTTLAAALVASVTFGGAALAGGDYYEGASKEATSSRIDRVQTSSVGDRAGFVQQHADQDVHQTLDTGDYYEGVNRPQ